MTTQTTARTARTAQTARAGGAGAAFADLYAEVQQFYARHMHLLDAGAAAEWAETFCEDAVMDLPGRPEPIRGRDVLARNMAAGWRAIEDAGEVQRHWHGMVDVDPRPDGTLAVRCYALVFATVKGGESRLHRICVCEDEMVREDGRLRVRSRRVTRDDLAGSADTGGR